MYKTEKIEGTTKRHRENKNRDIEFSGHDKCIRNKTTQKTKIILLL